MSPGPSSGAPADALARRMAALGIQEKELVERFDRANTPGGQHANKVETGVTVTWREFTATARDSRSQAFNRQAARLRLCELVERAAAERRAERRAERAKVRRQNSPRPRGLKERILESKRRRSKIKRLRKAGDE
jgi:protein subunit release factor B